MIKRIEDDACGTARPRKEAKPPIDEATAIPKSEIANALAPECFNKKLSNPAAVRANGKSSNVKVIAQPKIKSDASSQKAASAIRGGPFFERREVVDFVTNDYNSVYVPTSREDWRDFASRSQNFFAG